MAQLGLGELEDEGRTLDTNASLFLRGVLYSGSHRERIRDLATSHKVFIGMKVPRMDCALEQTADLVAECAIRSSHKPLVAYREISRLQLTRPDQFMPFVRECIQACDLILILYDPELRGGLIEAGIAYGLNKPIWLVARSDVKVSNSAIGCANRFITYQDLADLRTQLLSVFERLAGQT